MQMGVARKSGFGRESWWSFGSRRNIQHAVHELNRIGSIVTRNFHRAPRTRGGVMINCHLPAPGPVVSVPFP